jgi:hypothetical protein
MIQKLDLDDSSVVTDYRFYPKHFQAKLDELHININTVLVRPDPANIRVLAAEEASPVRLWRLYLLTGEDTAQLLEDGIHLRRRGLPEKILGSPVKEDDERCHSEMSSVLWRPNARGGWTIDANGSGLMWRVSRTTVDETIKNRSSEVGQATYQTAHRYQLDCAALHQFAQPLRTGEGNREMIFKVDVPVRPDWRPKEGADLPCNIDLQRESVERRR